MEKLVLIEYADRQWGTAAWLMQVSAELERTTGESLLDHLDRPWLDYFEDKATAREAVQEEFLGEDDDSNVIPLHEYQEEW
jgi:hypothetical protein